MSKKVNLALLTLAAFLLLGFSITANAGKPEKLQHIVSGPLPGTKWQCPAANLTDQTIFAELHFIDGEGTDTYSSVTILAGKTAQLGFNFTGDALGYVRCEWTWMGSPGDLRASFCAYYPSNTYTNPACSDLY